MTQNIYIHMIIAIFVMIFLLFAGCTSAPPSDIPWNTPQSWEGNLVLPGFENR